MDELLWAAMWLYKVTRREDYFRYIIDNAHNFGGTTWAMTEFSWDVKYAGIQILAAKVNPHPFLRFIFSHLLIMNYFQHGFGVDVL